MDPPDAFLENYTRGAPHPRRFCRRQSRLAMLRMFPLPQSICQTLFYLLRRRRCRRAQSAFCNLATAVSVYSLDTCECVLLRSRRWHGEENAVSTYIVPLLSEQRVRIVFSRRAALFWSVWPAAGAQRRAGSWCPEEVII
jgi:hypothetical protein